LHANLHSARNLKRPKGNSDAPTGRLLLIHEGITFLLKPATSQNLYVLHAQPSVTVSL